MVQIMPDIKPDKSNTFEFFVYKVTTAIVFILGISALCQKLSAQENLAIPMVRVHKSDDADTIEEYLNSVCAAVTFLLNEKYMAGMQGIQLINFKGSPKELGYRITNARSSLYTFLPKTFTAPGFAPAFDKLAIVIVSQRVASKHRHQDDNYSLVNLFGRVDEQTIQLNRNFLTFADNLYKRDIHTHPKFLIDTVHRLYDEQGVRDILYIAKAPFTSLLHTAAYEKFDKELTLKLNPYQDILEDDNVSSLNTFSAFLSEKPAFNLFAFMTKIQRIVSLIETQNKF
jgi:hypothetical protein